ncbi:hypothetical protein G6514_004811 [Epicoccum nigrum]|nr:hypothetical protein G6514_004811 [Epicoccum nigrum]
MRVNDEAKVRRSTKPLILGRAKVMGYDELKEAREKRAEAEAATRAKGKGKRGRKRTYAAVEADAAEPKPPVPADAQVSRMLVAEDETILGP